MVTVNEGSTSYHDFAPLGADGLEVSPEAIRYKLVAGGGVEILPWTTVPSTSRQIEISAELNIIGDTGRSRYLAVEITHSGGAKITAETSYTINDLRSLP